MPYSLHFLIALWLCLAANYSLEVETLQISSSDDPSCPLNFDILRKLIKEANGQSTFMDVTRRCQYVVEGIRIVRAEYLRRHGYFLPSSVHSDACWASYQVFIKEYAQYFDVESACGYNHQWMSKSCMNVTTRSEYEKHIPLSKLQEVTQHCNKSLKNRSQCTMCTQSLVGLRAHLCGPEKCFLSECAGYPLIYVAAFVNPFGYTDVETVKCLFSLKLVSRVPKSKHHIVLILGPVLGCLIGIFGAISVVFIICLRHKKSKMERQIVAQVETASTTESSFMFELNTSGSSSLVKYRYEEIKQATQNFSRKCLIGTGRYGNVFKGVLKDGSEVAVKRSKNCSRRDDGTFAHEMEVIKSVKHVNLVSLRGCCIASLSLEGHQRIIVCDLMHNGSLFDHLFGAGEKRLSWPIRRKIALGTARGLAYLHHGAHPAIIHRDVKPSNILLDDNFEAKLADFGLAKFNPNEKTHLSTRLAGTLGYVAPEYALYGQVAEGSDVYSFGVVLLEPLSGKKAVLSVDDGTPSLLIDWALSLVKEGRALDVIEENMPELDSPETMEQHVLVAVLCCHPHLHARPTMDQVVKILETNMPLSVASS